MKNIKLTCLTLFLILADITIAQEFPTNGEIYNYEVGDIFHYRKLHAYGEYSIEVTDSILQNIEVVDKYYSVNYDTVCYQYFIQQLLIYEWEQETIYTEYYLTLCISQLDSLREGDTVIEDPDVYNGRKMVKYDTNYFDGSDEIHISNWWVVGCGMAFYYYWEWGWVSLIEEKTTHELIYFHKGDEEWGEEQIILDVPEKDFNTKIIIYPNPIRNYLNISFNMGYNNGRLIKIYNSAGQLVKSVNVSLGDNRINVSYLPNGLYFISVTDENEQVVFKEKFLKVH